MGISRISTLFAANIDPTYKKQAQPTSKLSNESFEAGSEAVTVSAGISQGAESAEKRASRVAQLQAQVNSKEYKVPTEKLAEAVYRDLL